MNIALIGLGVIAEKFIVALEQEKEINLLYVCDIQKTPLAESLSSYCEFLYYYQEIPLDDLDYVFITTPPNTHFEIASYFLIRKINVFLEKPATPDLASLEKLIGIAKANHAFFDVILHWRFGNEVLFLQRHKNLVSGFSKISTIVKDPYYDGRIIRSKLHLGGAWLDSGVNAIAFLSDFLDLNKLKLIDSESMIDPITGQDYYVRKLYEYQRSSSVEIIIDWNPAINKKHSFVRKENTLLYIDHSNQIVLANDELIYKGDKQDRLVTHYHNFFASMKNHVFDLDYIYRIHKLLFAVKENKK